MVDGWNGLGLWDVRGKFEKTNGGMLLCVAYGYRPSDLNDWKIK